MSNMTLIVLIVLALVIIWMVTNFIINKRSVTELNQEEFQEGIRKAQVIDLRERQTMIMVILLVHEISL